MAAAISIATVLAGATGSLINDTGYHNDVTTSSIIEEYNKVDSLETFDNIVLNNVSNSEVDIQKDVIYPTMGMEINLPNNLRYSDSAERIINNQRITRVGNVVEEGNYTVNYMAVLVPNEKGIYSKKVFTTNPGQDFIDKYSSIPDVKFAVHLEQGNNIGGLGWVDYDDIMNVINPDVNINAEGGKHL